MVGIWKLLYGPQPILFIFYNKIRCCNSFLMDFTQELILGLGVIDFKMILLGPNVTPLYIFQCPTHHQNLQSMS